MNRPFVLVLVRELVLDRPTWFRGRGRGRERLGSWSQCARVESWRLSMNRPFVLLLVLVIDSSSWLRGRGRERLGSWSQCATEKSWRLSMNRPFVLVLVLELVLDRPTWFRGRGRGRERLGSWSQCAMLESWKLSMNRAGCGSQTRGPDRASVRRSGSWSQCATEKSWRLSMNRTPSSHPFSPLGGKVPGGRVSGKFEREKTGTRAVTFLPHHLGCMHG